MKSPFSQKLDSDQIRQGLISIRNTQLELLNQLKYETEILKHYSPPSTTSEYSERAAHQQKFIDRFPSFSLQSNSNIQDFASKIRQNEQQPLFFNEKELKDEINYLKNENKLMNNNYQKLKKSCQSDKDKVSELEANMNFISKFYYDILLQILDNSSISSIRQFIYSQTSNASQQKGQMKTFIEDILMLLNEKQKNIDESAKLKAKIQSEKEIANQLIDLKSQISLLINHSNQASSITNQQDISKLKSQIEQKNRHIEQLSNNLKKIENQNKELSKFWDKQLNQRKKAMLQLQKIRKQAKTWEQKQKKIIFYAKDMQSRALKAEKIIKEKQKTQSILKENSSKLTQTLSVVRQSNQSLRLQVKSLEQNKEKRLITLVQQKRQLQNEFKMFKLQQQKLMQSKEAQLLSLKNHINQLKKNQESLKEYDRKTKDNQLIQQDIYWKKVNIIRTNSTIDHLWQVKEVQYQNINELLGRMKK